MKILGLDCATKTGWCIVEDGEIVESGVQSFAKKRGESNGILFMRFRKWLKDLVEMIEPDVITYERAHFRGGAATEIGVGLQTRAMEAAADFGIESCPYTTGEIKKRATGMGNAGKPEMIAAAEPILGRPPIDDNEADAVFVALLGHENLA